MNRDLYAPSARALAALGAAPAAPVAYSVKESAPAPSQSRKNFLAGRGFAASAPQEPGKIVMYSPEFYAACTAGGIVACGATHTAVTPLDIVKCNMQVDPARFKSIPVGFNLVMAEQGAKGLFKGWGPTALGYSAQGACKFGFYEFFKKYYSDLAGPENFEKYQDFIYLAGSASAEFIADVALCPFEAVKARDATSRRLRKAHQPVKVQTVPGFANGLSDGMPKFIQQEGFGGLYRGLTSLWGRQIPYTMMKFGAFERTVQLLYANVVPKPREECSKSEQLGVSFAAGYIAGIFCAVVSHPADNLVSKLNANKAATVSSVVSEMGMVALLTRGLPLRIIMVGTLTGLQWGIYDAFKVAVGLPTTGAKTKK